MVQTAVTNAVGLEATGHYWLSVYSFMREKGFRQHVINPIQTDGWRKGIEIRKRKTDTIDSLLIADLVRYGDFIEARLPDEAVLSLKNLTRFRTYLVDSISDLKRKVICVLDQVFPEIRVFFRMCLVRPQKKFYCNFQVLPNLKAYLLIHLPNCLRNSVVKKSVQIKRICFQMPQKCLLA